MRNSRRSFVTPSRAIGETSARGVRAVVLLLASIAATATAARAEEASSPTCLDLGFSGLAPCGECDVLAKHTAEADDRASADALHRECLRCCAPERRKDGAYLAARLEVCR